MAVIEVELRDDVIRLGQLLQLAGVVDSGSEAKALLASGQVAVNGVAEARRGRQIRMGDVVEVGEQQITVREPSG